MPERQVIVARESRPSGLWKDKASTIVKWVAGERGKAGVPHQVRKKQY